MSLPPGRDLLKEVKGHNRVYIETGTWRGDSIQQAINAGYETIIGVEADPEQYRFCYNRFDHYNNPRPGLHFINGDSSVALKEALNKINEPATILLDAHSQHMEGEKTFAMKWPLMHELNLISDHIRGTGIIHTILIDDILILTHPDVTGWSLKDIIERVRWIYVHYAIELIANPVKNNFLIAKP